MDAKNVPVFRNDPIIVLLLGIVTCGLYLIYWNYKIAEVLNAVTGKELISTPVAIISGCCLPVNLYFYYLAGQGLEELGKAVGRDLKDKGTMLIILGFFVPMVSAMIVQGHVNELYDRKS